MTKSSETTHELVGEWVPIERLMPWVKNPRRNDEAVKKVADSIRRFGFASPIVARRENCEVIAGHTRLKAARLLGLKEVPVRFLDIDEETAHKLALADNKLNETSKWDEAALGELLASFGDTSGIGFSDEELARLTGMNYESEVVELDTSAARVEFFCTIHGPLKMQPDALGRLKQDLAAIEGVKVSITTTEQ